jgi:hypothetical protein
MPRTQADILTAVKVPFDFLKDLLPSRRRPSLLQRDFTSIVGEVSSLPGCLLLVLVVLGLQDLLVTCV